MKMTEPKLEAFLASQGMTLDDYYKYEPAEMGGILDSYQGLNSLGQVGDTIRESSVGTEINTDTPKGLDNRSWGEMGFMDQSKVGLGVGQLGLGVMGYMDQKKTAKKQRELMGQQLESNRFALDTAKGRQSDISRSFGLGR
jgi:hypothetical protein